MFLLNRYRSNNSKGKSHHWSIRPAHSPGQQKFSFYIEKLGQTDGRTTCVKIVITTLLDSSLSYWSIKTFQKTLFLLGILDSTPESGDLERWPLHLHIRPAVSGVVQWRWERPGGAGEVDLEDQAGQGGGWGQLWVPSQHAACQESLCASQSCR